MEASVIEKKIYYHDTDAGGVVYYGSYLEHFEEGRNEFFAVRGVDIALFARQGVIFPVVHLEMDFKRPARYGDKIKVATRIEKVGNASIHFLQEISLDSEVLVLAKTVCACVDNRMKPSRIPEEIRSACL